MSFLRHLRHSQPEKERRGTPDWALPLTPGEFELFISLVAKEIPGLRDPNVLRDAAFARRLNLEPWPLVLAKTPKERWPELIHGTWEQASFVAAGEDIEARSQSFEAAREFLRVHWLMRGREPAGDVAVDGPAPDTLEVLCLDAGRSIRHVSRRLLEKWGVTADEAARAARERVLELPIDRLDLSQRGHPAVRALSVENEGPYAGALLPELERIAPDAIGVFGTLVGAPTPGALVVLALNPTPALRTDVAALAVFVATVLTNKPKETVFELPLWRQRDGTLSQVAVKFSDDLDVVLDSYHPAFASILTALDPITLLSVPDWARARGMSDREYTRFAGCVSAAAGIPLAAVADSNSGLSLAGLAEECRTIPFEAWPELVATNIAATLKHIMTVRAAAEHAADDPAAVLSQLVTWLDFGARDNAVSRPLGNTGYVEVLGIYAEGSTALGPSEAAALGQQEDLFDRAEAAIRARLSVRQEPMPFVSGQAFQVSGQSSASAAIPHLCDWLPEVVGPYGAFAAIGDRDRSLVVLPIHDATALIDLPSLLGLAVGANARASWPIAPAVFWIGPGTLVVVQPEPREGAFGVASSADLMMLASRLPADPRAIPPGLSDILGPDGARRLLGITHTVMLEQLGRGTCFEITVSALHDFAQRCTGHASAEWPGIIREAFEEGIAWSSNISALAASSDYNAVEPALVLRLSREGLSGSSLAEHVGGGIDAYPVLHVGVRGQGGRSRRVTTEMLGRWGIDPERCRHDAGANVAASPELIDEPMFEDAPWLRELSAAGEEYEAVGLYLHLRQPTTKRGFLVAIAHPARVYYGSLDDERTVRSIPGFAGRIANIYRNADAANDALSPWLLWVTSDGRVIPLFDVRKPVPSPNQLPPEFVRVMAGARRN